MNFRKVISNNLSLKIFALIISVSLWLYVYFVYGARINKTASIQIQTLNIPQELSVSLSSKYIDITFTAPARIIEQVEKSIRAVMDLSNIGPGTFKRKVDIVYPKEAEIIKIDPEEVEITVEKIISKEFKIKGIIKGKTTPGNALGTPELTPSVITIQETESLVNSIKEVIIEINVDNASSDIYGSAEVIVVGKDNKPIEDLTISNKIVNFHLPIISSNISKIVPAIPTFTGYSKFAIVEVKVFPEIVKIRGSGELVGKINSIETEAINIDGLSKDSTFQAKLKIPEGLTSEPEVVEVQIRVEEIITKTLNNVKIKILNLKDGLKVNLDTNVVQVSITGRKSVVESIKSIEAQIDLKEFDVGDYRIGIQVKDIPSTVFIRIYPEEITLKITKE